MADKNFFKCGPPAALKDLAELTGAKPGPSTDPGFMIEDVAPLDQAGPKDISFFDNVKYKDAFLSTKAGACVVGPKFADQAPEGVHILVSESPYKAYALIAQKFYPDEKPEGQIAEGAFVHETAEIGDGCTIDHGAAIMEGARIGENCWIGANAVIGAHVVLGAHCRVGANASLSHAVIGDHVRIYPGVRIGQDGFGFAIDPAGHVKVPQLGRVIIEDHVEIGANTTIDRGAGPDTVIGQGTWIDNLVQIGHNAKIGKGCVIVAHVGIAGSSVLEDFVSLGGQVGIAGHLRVGKGAQIAAQAGVMRDVPPGEQQAGTPAEPIREHMRQITALKRLIQKGKSS